MNFIKYTILVLTLAVWFADSTSPDEDSEEIQGDREKRTLILGVLLKNLLVQQAQARNNVRANATTARPPQANRGPVQQQTSPSPPPEQQQSSQQPAQPPPPPQNPPPVRSMPQGIPTPPSQPQGPPPPPPQGFPQFQEQRLGHQGFAPFNPGYYSPQQSLYFQANYPFGVQGLRQHLPFGPAPPLGAQAGPQNFPRFPTHFGFNYQTGVLQGIPQRPSLLPAPQSPQAAARSFLFATPQPQLDQVPPSGDGQQEQAPPSGPGPSASGSSAPSPGPDASASGPSGPSPSGPGSSDLGPSGPGPSEAGIDAAQTPPQENQSPPPQSGAEPTAPEVIPPSGPSNPPEPQSSQLPSGGDNLQQNFQFGPGPSQSPQIQPSVGDASQRFFPNFLFDQQQGARPPSPQEAPQPPQSDPSLQQQLETQLQQQLSSNGLTPDPQQNLASPSPQQPAPQPDNNFFDVRQFADGTDNRVFDFLPQQGGSQPDQQQQQQQQQTQQQSFSNNFQNGLLASPNGQQQLSSSGNDPRLAFAFRGQPQQFDFPSQFQDSGNFQGNFFQ